MEIRQPIVVVLGHVDSGKTSLLDRIRGTGVQGREAGGITQHIGASFLPTETIKETCGQLYKKLQESENQVPGILVIDTPGHEIFTNLRARGGSAADIAILVVDVNRGFQPQTNESLKILQSRKVPFVVALNKCDQISGWRKSETKFITQAIKEQDPFIQTDLDQKIYDVVGTLSILGYQSEAFYRVKDFKTEIAIVPISARSGVGIPELLAVLVGLTQQYLQKRLEQKEKESRGIVLEVNDEIGLGHTANIILIDGSIKKGDSIVVAKRDSVIVTKPKAILLPKPLDEMRDPRDKFKPVSNVSAAAGLKIASPDLEGVLPGSTLYVVSNESDIEKYTKLIESEMKSVFIDTETNGVVLKCDTIGSLEAIVEMLRRSQVPISKADIGPVNRRDIMETKAIKE
ncbi:MAG: translation initiation factor IF-2, partial [Nitrosarchaeum sp.]|nr:translation initiation factor IF-2 [Nitrosarchaeum sp.]